jgi:RNA polymerase sigma-70 factor (ECF subfamily)
VPDHSEAVLDAIDLDSTGNKVQRAFAHLNSRDQQILLLCVLEDLSMTDVSRLLRIPSGTVKSRLFRAKRHLALVLNEYNPIQPSPSVAGEST